MEIAIRTALKDRKGNALNQTVGDVLVTLIDNVSMQSAQAMNPRLLFRVANRIADAPALQVAVTVNAAEEAALKALLKASLGMSVFYYHTINALLWPDDVESQEDRPVVAVPGNGTDQTPSFDKAGGT